MPVTAKLSKLFYDRLGEQVANELVEWFNQVDATYRSDLRELNELNFGRFRAEGQAHWAEHRAWTLERFAEMDVRFAEMDVRFAEMDAKFEKRFAEMDARFASLEATIERRFAEQTRFLYLALATQIALIAGLYLR